MAFLTMEDIYGTVEVIVFPKDYQKMREEIRMERAFYIKGRASVSEESGKLIAGRMIPMDTITKEVWIQTNNISHFKEKQNDLYDVIRQYPGKDELVIYSREEKAVKRLPSYQNISGKDGVIALLRDIFGEKNVVTKDTSPKW